MRMGRRSRYFHTGLVKFILRYASNLCWRFVGTLGGIKYFQNCRVGIWLADNV